jgi:hypothetical protein
MRAGNATTTCVCRNWLFVLLALCFCAASTWAEDAPAARSFPQSKAMVEKAWAQLKPYASGRLPSLAGFAASASHPLDRYQRGFYQCAIQVIANPAGGSQVRVTARITAWYAAAEAVQAGYQVLPSNGRLEGDLLDRLQEALGDASPGVPSRIAAPKSSDATGPADALISAPMPRIPESALRGGLFAQSHAPEKTESLKTQTDAAEKHERELAAEAKSLEEILQNQAHPNNLVAVRRDGTPVLTSPRADAGSLFAASAGDEFETLDATADWVHVRISGLSRGWIRRSSLEMSSENTTRHASAEKQGPARATFRVTGQQFAPFPGDWVPLRGKTVEIVSIQGAAEGADKDSANPQAKLEFAKALINQEYPGASPASDGIVLIFDSDDGGMVAASFQSVQQWRTGKLSDQAFWKQCFFDPPQILGTPLE